MDKTFNIIIKVCHAFPVNTPSYISWFTFQLYNGSDYEFIDVYHPYSYKGHHRNADFKSIKKWLSRSS